MLHKAYSVRVKYTIVWNPTALTCPGRVPDRARRAPSWRPESMFYRQDTTVSSLERLGEAGWLPDVRKEESLRGQACNQPIGHTVRYSEYGFTFQISQPLYTEAGRQVSHAPPPVSQT